MLEVPVCVALVETVGVPLIEAVEVAVTLCVRLWLRVSDAVIVIDDVIVCDDVTLGVALAVVLAVPVLLAVRVTEADELTLSVCETVRDVVGDTLKLGVDVNDEEPETLEVSVELGLEDRVHAWVGDALSVADMDAD